MTEENEDDRIRRQNEVGNRGAEKNCACSFKNAHACFCAVSDDREIGIECSNYKECECPCHSKKEKEVEDD